MKEITNSKKSNNGDMSLIISSIAVIFSFTYIGGKYIGQHILNALGIPLPHSIISIILFCISILIGYKNRENHYGKAGMALSTIFLGFIAISSLI
jgi:putative effector of murein hydrolase LrgA (UPF0299 family)